MPINNLEFATQITGELDKAIVQKAVTGFFNDNAFGAKFVGAKTVSVPVMDMDGLGDYDRDAGYTQGGVNLEYVDYTLTMDRGRTFQIDAQDADETGVAGLAGKVSGEFVRTKVVPEVDAYVLSKLGKHAENEKQTVDGDLDTDIFKLFNEMQVSIGGNLDFNQELVCFVNPTVWGALMNTPALSRSITVSDFKQGDINLQVKSLNGIALIPVSDSRMYTEYTFNDGKDVGQTAGGFTKTEGAKHIGMLMLPKSACMLVKKTDKVRVFDPMTTQHANAWKIDYRVYYDALIKESEKAGIFAYLY
jgi:hypothetical protein